MDHNRIERTYIVSATGLRDFDTLQGAINAAHSVAPTADLPYQVLVMPGVYRESLVLYDHVHIKGCGPNRAVVLEYENAGVIEKMATCKIENLAIARQSDDAGTRLAARIGPAVTAGVAGASLTLRHISFGSESSPGQQFLSLVAGTVTLEDCILWGGFYEAEVIKQEAGTSLHAWRCRVICKTDTPSPARGAIHIAGGEMNYYHCRIEAQSASSIYGVQVSVDPGMCRWLHCNFRGSNGASGFANTSGSSVVATFGRCAINVARTGAYSGLADFVVNTGA